ncbi:WXG100 family type VII secretion target [Kitasatospora sp. NPDC053057]|uniref:WXG100 family type VII secretion target n=1 Tax=Kitasatospora sp. NPDC053057 TaxID=3364062 RepID=UPI0037CB7F5B
MTDLDFERRVNPWLFDSSGNLTEAAKKQFPDLAAAAAGAQPPGWSPEPVVGASGSGPTVKVSPEALRRAATNAETLHTKFDKACQDIWRNNLHPTEDVSGDWAIVKAIEGMGQIWGGQVSATSQMMGNISTALASNADQYARAEQANAQNFGTS